MYQPPLFEYPDYEFVYSKRPGSRRRSMHQEVTVYDPDQFAVIAVWSDSHRQHPRKSELLEAARRAWLFYHQRPFGDSYYDGNVFVAYLTDLVVQQQTT